MHSLGDEIILDSFRIPWLIWIHLLIFLLLILLLSYSGLFSLDLLPARSPPPSPVSYASVVVDALSCSQERDPEAHERRPRESTERESITEGNASSMKDLQRLFRPCYYFEIAKQAFLQCLGLGYPPPNSRERRHEAHEQRPRESTEGESITEGNASSMKDLQRLLRPCYYFEIAKQAFLQCLGLGYPPPNSRERRHDE